MDIRSLLVVLWVAASCCEMAEADQSRTFLDRHCIQCHGADRHEADLRLDTIQSPDAESAATWAMVADQIESGDMPPEPEPRPDSAQTKRMLMWIGDELARVHRPAPAIRRLNRFEYECTVRDLLGIDASLAALLPEDGQVQGFDNVATGLGISSILMERYLEAADVAFENTIRRLKPLPPETRRVNLMDVKENISSVKGKKGGVIEASGAMVDFTPGWPPARVDGAHPIEGGKYRCRIAVWPHDPGEARTLSVGVFTGPLFGPGKRNFDGMFDVTGTPDQPRIIEFTTRMNEGDAIHILPWIYPEHVTWRDKDEPRPGVAIAWAETHGPLDQTFPASSQVNLFGQSETLSFEAGDSVYLRHRRGVRSHFVGSSDPREDIERIIRNLAPKAFRRPVEKSLVDQFVELAWSRLDHGNSFEDAVRAGVTAVLCSPHFLLLNQHENVDDYAIASRLSYFLWSSMPDSELLRLADAGKLSDAGVRYAQVERMIKDPKIHRFVESFTDQWLDLRDIEFTTPDKKLYPEYDELLMRSMLSETRGFFERILENDLSVLNFVDSDFAVLNQRLANHYGISDIRGHEDFRLVPLPDDSVRGGLLAQASVLKVTANGTTTSPVLRGAWVLDRLLSRPPPPPPPSVPAVEPDIRGATTIRDQLKLHSENASCARCHRRIDPPGFAMEEFDVIGGHRRTYRSLEGERSQRVAKTNYYNGLAVDSSGQLPGDSSFSDFTGFRQCLMEDPDAIARGFAEKLLVYGCGRPVTRGEQSSVEAVVDSARDHQFGLRSMIHAVVESDLFLRP